MIKTIVHNGVETEVDGTFIVEHRSAGRIVQSRAELTSVSIEGVEIINSTDLLQIIEEKFCAACCEDLDY